MSPVSLRPRLFGALVADVLLVVAFAAAGRASHRESDALLGAVTTAGPFLVGTACGWGLVRVLRRRWPLDLSAGVTVWFATLVIGMVLRRATGQGTAVSFVVVAAVVLAVFLLGWRAVAGVFDRRRAARGRQASRDLA
jgi:ribose/xylose/arabinose/galactoside ABC-type transport system permease subunit